VGRFFVCVLHIGRKTLFSESERVMRVRRFAGERCWSFPDAQITYGGANWGRVGLKAVGPQGNHWVYV
jgi:hypothetical protein